MPGIIGKKIGMTSVFDAEGKNIPCTVIEAGPCVVTQVKTAEVDGYEALQLAYDDKTEKRTNKCLLGHFKKANSAPKYKVAEVAKNFSKELMLGDTVTVAELKEDEWVDVTGTSKGKGFQGVVRRYGFQGVGGTTHGQSDRLRHPGSMGASSYPSRVFKGKRLAGHMGSEKVKILNLRILKVLPENNLLLVKGSIP